MFFLLIMLLVFYYLMYCLILAPGVFSPILSTSFLLSIIKALPTKNKYYLQLQAKKSCENFMCMAMSVFSYTHLFLLSISNQFLQ